MKKHLLFNQSFGTEGSPNQTGETLTRENRIGLMSYLRRTLMLLLVAYIGIGQMWGATSTYDVATLFTANSWRSSSPSTSGSSLNQTISNITYAFATGSGSGVYTNSSTTIQFFDQGATITVSTNSSYKITQVAIVVSNKSNSPRWCAVTNGSGSAVAGTWKKGDATYTVGTNIDVATYTFTPTSATTGNSLVFTIDRSSGTGGYIRITSITATYESGLPAPTATFNDGIYAIGGSALNLSSLWTSDSDGAVTFSVDSAGTTGASVSTDAFSATTAGYAKVKAVQAATATKTAITKYAYIQVGNATTGSHTLTYTLDVPTSSANGSKTTINTTYISTSIYLNTLVGLTNNTGSSYGAGDKVNMTVKVPTTESYTSSKYTSVGFTVEDGYKFTPTSISVKIQPVTAATSAKLILTDGTHSIEKEQTSLTAGSLNTITMTNDGSVEFTGDVTLKIYGYGDTKCIRLGSPITITGTVAAAAGCTDVAAPTELSCTNIWSNNLTFGWTAALNADHYTATLYSDAECNTQVKQNTSISGTSTTFNGIAPNTTYYCKVQSHGNGSTYCANGGTTATAASGKTLVARIFKSGEYVYFKDASGPLPFMGGSQYWKQSGGDLCAYFYDDAEPTQNSAWATALTMVSGSNWNEANNIYRIIVPQLSSEDHEWTGVIFTRGSSGSSWTFDPEAGFWEQTEDQQPALSYNLFKINNDAADGKWKGTWARYTENPALVGDFNNWEPTANVFGNYSSNVGNTLFTLNEASTNYKFKILDGEKEWSYDASSAGWTITNTTTTSQQLYDNNDVSNITSTEVGEYEMKYNKNTHTFIAAYYPKERLTKNTILYFDARRETNWKSAAFHTKFYFKKHDKDEELDVSPSYWFGESPVDNADDNWVYYITLPNCDNIGKVQLMRINPNNHGEQWCYSNMVSAGTRSSVIQNCLIEEVGKEDVCSPWNPGWQIYCPPTTSETFTDNSTSVIAGTSGDGTSGNPYLVPTTGTINVQASASKAVNDGNMTINYDFKVGGSSEQAGEGNMYSKGSLSNNTTYTMSVDAYTVYNLDDSKNSTKHTPTALYYKALDVYTISYNKGSNGTGDNTTAEKIYGISKTLLGATFTREGYTQTAWNTDPSGTGGTSYSLGGSYTGNAAVTLYPTWTAKTTSITLDKNGGDTDGSATATYGSGTLTSLTHATRTGYTQNGYETSDHTLIIKDDETFDGTRAGYTDSKTWVNESANVTLYARWTAIEYTLSYNLNGGSVASPNSTSYTIESEAITLNNPTKTGYTFAGWTGTGLAEATTTVTIAAGSTGNRSYTATWTAIVPSSVSLNKSSTTITEGGTETLTATITPAVVADNTITWSTSDADVATVDGGVVTAVAAGTATITATTVNSKTATCEVTVTPAVTYTVTYVYNGATGGDDTPSATGASVTLPEPTKTGYELEGWYTTAGAKVDDGGETYSPTADITLYARWTETCSSGSTTTWDFSDRSESGFTSGSSYSFTATDGATEMRYTAGSSEGIVAKTEKKTGYLKENGNTGGGSYTDVDGKTAIAKNRLIRLFVGNGSGTLRINCTADHSGTWKVLDGSASGSTLIASLAMNTTSSSITVANSLLWIETTAKGYITSIEWTTGSGGSCYGVYYHGNGAESGYIYDPNVYDDGDDPEVLGNTTGTNGVAFVKDGYTFQGWATSAEGSVAYSAGDEIENIEDDVNLYAVWEEEDSGYTVSIAANPAGYGTVSSSSVTSVASGTTLSASTNTLSVGATDVTASATSATAEYTYAFSNWTKSDGTALPLTVTADLSVYANFTRSANSYTLTWDANGGSDGACTGSCTSGSTAYNTTLVAPSDPTLSNYTFDGWKTNNDGTGSAAAATMPAEDVTYYAAWKQTVTLTTGAQGSGDNQTPYVYLNGTGVSSFTPHTASGYSLQGYYTAGSGGVKVLNADGTFASANVDGYITSSKWSRTGAAPTLYAQWVASEDCSTSDFVIRKGNDTEYQGCMESSSYNGTATSFTAGSPTTVGNAKMTISNYDGGIKRPGSGNTFSIVIEPVSGYYLKSICWAGKVEDDETVSYYWDNNSGSATTITPQTTSGTGVTYDAPNSTTTKFTASYTDDGDGSGGIWWRNVQVEVCAAGVTTYSVTYDGNDETSGSVPTGATNYSYGATVTVLDNTGSFAKTNYSFVGWSTNDDGTGSNYVADNTFSITANTTLYAKWTQAVTFDANTANHGSTGGSATAVWNATGLTSITHATPASGYKLLGYYTAPTSGTKVLNSDGSFAGDDITDWIDDGKWVQNDDDEPLLYAQYESAGALTWNLIVNSDTTNLSTSTKTSAFTEISTTNMTDAALTGLTYSKGKKSSLTGKISTPDSYNADKYVYVTFQVADGYKFTPSSISVKVQPVGENEHKAVELSLADATNTLASSSATKCDGTEKGKTTTVTLAGDGTDFKGTVTLKIYVYPHAEASAANYNCYRLGTPITIEGEIEEACGTMPSYTSMSYTTTTFAPGADASGSPITIVGGDNINTYQWKYNTVNDRTSGTNCGTGTSLTPLTDASATIDGTRYYWCEMTNNACGITIKSPAVAITVAAAKSDATVTWTNPASTPNYGGGGYTIKATVNETGWDGNAADLVITAPAGINIYNVTSGTTSNQKWVQADFDVQTSFDRSTYASNIPFTVSAAATATYNAISNDHNVSYSACTGGSASEELMPVNADSVNSTVKGWRFAGTGKMWFGHGSSAPSTGSSNIKSLDNTMAGGVINKYYNTSGSYFSFYTETAITGVRLYVYTSNSNVKVSNVYIANSQFATGTPSSGAVTYEVVYNDDNEGLDKGDNVYSAWAEITFDSEVAAGKYGLIKLDNNVRIAGIGLISNSGSGASLNTHLQWSGDLEDDATVGKYTTDAYFTYSASMITENTNSLGAITYSSSDPSVATVDATGKVAMVAAGTTTIKATLAASGCYKKAEISYTLNVTEEECAIAAGTLTLTSGSETKCEDDEVTLTLTDFESDAALQWKDGDTNINDGGNYKIVTDGTTSTLTTNQPGTYSVIVTKGCFVRSNRITISNISATASVTKIVDEWYVKNGRLTPDIELWSLSEGATLKSVAWSPDNATGLSCVARGGVIYLEGKSPSSNDSGDIEYTLTATITDECKADHEETTKTIKITHQKNTDKHVLAFVVTGTEKGGFTAGITAAQTTSVGLYNAIAAQFDVQTTNIYATDDEKKLKEYYSQYDILCITDYPNTGTKGVNKKSYVDAIGSLIDIRPILTMEAFVSKLANWKAKGISGNPKSPSTRQYTMDLQCKDHEIFAGTKLTKVGEGDEAMYRVSMVCDTLEDYKTLDATYGGGAHAEKTDYNYGGKPALQGFTFTEDMADDLLPIGLIDDGAGNPLQVGIERQENMEARLMVLGINSYAMERLTDDGERVVINALNYLMKKNAEDIADCSTSFVGGAEGEEKNWNNKDNWTGNTVPLPSQKVRILAECEVSSTVHALDVLIVTDGKYNHGSDNAAGKLTIKENGALIVGGKIQAASAPAYNRTRATTPDKLLIETSSTNQAALIFDNEEGETQATVYLYSLGRKPSSYQYQYFAVPMEVVPVNPVFANETHGGTGIYTYVYSEASSGWERRKYYDDLFAFEGLGITTKSATAMEYEMTGNLASTATKEITLTHDGAGLNLVGNSWMAPIQIGALAEDNTDANITQTAYIYCAGRDIVEGAATSGDTETAGQWIAIPFEAAEFETWKATGKLSVIPAMQAFQIKVSAEATLTLDYDKVVRGSTNDLNAKLRAPGRRMAANEVTMTNIRVADSKTHTDLSLFEGDRFSEAFDNGWEAEYMNGDGRSAKLYAETEAGQMAVAAMYDYEGTVVGFAPGQETEYTFSFMGEDNGYYLNDIKLQNSVRISEGETYTFTYEEGDAANRFYISRTAINAPEVATGMENLDAAAPKVQKIIYNDKLYIIRGGRLYDATGKVVK